MNRILILDDEFEIINVLSLFLEKQGYQCVGASSAKEAKEILARDQINLALVDIDLPGESGLDFVTHARAFSPDTVIIMITGIDSEEAIETALEAGTYAYILKPFNKSQILLLIKNALRHREIEIQNRLYREALEKTLAERILSLRESEVKLKSTESAFRKTIEAANEGVCICKENYHIFVNKKFAQMFGYNSPRELIGKEIFLVVHPDDKAKVAQVMDVQLSRGEMPERYEFRGIRRDGSTIDVELSVAETKFMGDLVKVGFFRDISDQKRAQEQKDREHKQLLSIFNSITEIIYVSDPLTYEILFVNKILENSLGRDPVGSICYKEFQGLDSPCDFCTNEKILKNKGRPYYWDFYNHKLGRHFKVVDRIIRWPDGRDARFEFAVDVTHLKKAEKDLKQANEKAILLLKAITSILIALDEKGSIVEWNKQAEAIFKIPRQEALGKDLIELALPWDLKVISHGIETCKGKDQEIRLDDVTIRLKGQGERLMGVTISSIMGDDGGYKGTLIRANDITERRLLEKQLAQAQKLEAVGQLAAGIAHEINTPTQFIGDNLNFLKDGFGDLNKLINEYEEITYDLIHKTNLSPIEEEKFVRLRHIEEEIDVNFLKEEIPKALDQSLEGVQRVSKIVGAMKEFSHPGSAEKIPTDLNHAIDNTIIVAKNEWKYVADVERSFDPNLPLVPCLPGDINQVILNLLVNAAHAIESVVGDKGGEKGKINIATRSVGNWVEIKIRDTGTGIPPQIRERIFDPFFTTKEVGKGTGQGLFIAHNIIVEKHGGTINFETEEGKGTTFIIRLPVNGEC